MKFHVRHFAEVFGLVESELWHGRSLQGGFYTIILWVENDEREGEEGRDP